MKEIRITQNEENQRLDKYLCKYFNKAPKSFVYKMLRKKRIKRNGGRAEGNEILQAGDTLQLYLAEETMQGFMEAKSLAPAPRHFGIVYEDDDLLVVNKHAGLLTHPERKEDTQTLIDQVLYYLYEKGQYTPDAQNAFTPALCNRLDRNTSGIVVAGKTLRAVQAVNAAFKERKVEKYYVALVSGVVDKPGEIRLYLAKDEAQNQVRISQEAREGFRPALTKYRPLAYTADTTLLEMQLITGKTHQLRAHLQAIGHPIWGDRKYGDVTYNTSLRRDYAVSHQCLHAQRLVWKEKKGVLAPLYGKQMIAPLPKQMQQICEDLFGDTVRL